MKKTFNGIRLIDRIVFLTGMFAICVLFVNAAPAQQTDSSGYALLVQPSPFDGGSVTPQAGVHRFGLNESITLTAVPSTGYRFVYWLGDVTDTTSNQTQILINSPKIVVAIFERNEFDVLATETDQSLAKISTSGAGGGSGAEGGLIRQSVSFSSNSSVNSSGGIPEQPKYLPPKYLPPETDPTDDPGDENPIPEPATMAILGLGALVMAYKRK